jgi:TRAP-type C4-dicarboxylate transport system substrate-binding protein
VFCIDQTNWKLWVFKTEEAAMKLLHKSLISSLIALAMFGSGGAGAADYTLKLAHNGPEQHPFQDGALAFKSALEASTDGAVEVQIFPGEQLGSEEETSQMLKQGTLACAVESAGGGLAPFVPEADLFNLPFIFSDIDHFYRVVDGPVGESVAGKVEASLDSEFLGWWFSGVRNAWNGERPIRTPDDLQGLKIRVMGSPVLIDTFNTLGAQATPMSFGEVYTATCILLPGWYAATRRWRSCRTTSKPKCERPPHRRPKPNARPCRP